MEPNLTKATKVYDMCSYVGLEKKVARYILRQTAIQTDEYWIKRYMAKKYFKRSYKPRNTNEELQHMGFTPASACHLNEILEANPVSNHQSPLYWAELHVETMLKEFYDM